MCGSELPIVRSVQGEAAVSCSKLWLGELVTRVGSEWMSHKLQPGSESLQSLKMCFRNRYWNDHKEFFRLLMANFLIEPSHGGPGGPVSDELDLLGGCWPCLWT